MAKVPYYGWVEEINLHFIASDASEWSYEGDLVGASTGSKIGSLWIDTADNQIHYIDEYNDERYLPSEYEGGYGAHSDGAVHTDATAKPSAWVEVDLIRFIRTAAIGEEDFSHTDSGHSDQHSDAHTDLSHLDSHSDQTGAHGDSHSDIPHADGHGDVEDPPVHVDIHSDSPHTDSHDDSYSHNDSHNDRVHSDTHGDSHSDDVHGDQPVEIGP